MKFKRTKLQFVLLTDRSANRLKAFHLHREDCSRKKYLERENKQILPSLIDFMTLLFFSQNGSTAVPISHSKLDLKACLENKGVVRRLFGSILISYTSGVS